MPGHYINFSRLVSKLPILEASLMLYRSYNVTYRHSLLAGLNHFFLCLTLSSI